jgi:type IV pilus assembly protein PilC
MPTFAYTARSLNGELKSSTLEAPSRGGGGAARRRPRRVVGKIDEG